MKKKWDLSVRGKAHEVVIDGSTSGEDVIRVDGRVAARPLDADETQRAFYIDGAAYSLLRNGSRDFELLSIGTGSAARPAQPATVSTGSETTLRRWLRALFRSFRS